MNVFLSLGHTSHWGRKAPDQPGSHVQHLIKSAYSISLHSAGNQTGESLRFDTLRLRVCLEISEMN